MPTNTDWDTTSAGALAQEPAPEPAPPPHAVWPSRFQFVTGPAGSGKTTLVRERVHRSPNAVMCATTGIAAVNMGDAVTINSLLRYPHTQGLEQSYTHGYLQSRLRQLRHAGITRFVVDEISMMEARQLTILVRAMDELNDEGAVLRGDLPEIGLTLSGDFLQLPPVQGDFAFQSPEWPRFEIERLTAIHRQSDPVFVDALRSVRLGEAGAAASVFSPCCTRVADSEFVGTTVFGRNQMVDRFNRLRHDQLPGDPITYRSRSWSTDPRDVPNEWLRNIPVEVKLKRGALVMILANRYDAMGDDTDSSSIIYANGDLGILEDGDGGKKTALVRLLRTEDTVTVTYTTKKHERPTGTTGARKAAFETIAEISYMPLRLAYASTVHKAQGLSFDRVQLDLGDHFFSAPSMLYVGLTRARTLQGLQIVGRPEQLALRCSVDARVEAWK